MKENERDDSAEIYVEGAMPVQVFTSPVVAPMPGDDLLRRGRPKRNAIEQSKGGDSGQDPKPIQK